MRTPTIITTAAISLLCTLATLAREPQPVLKDYKSGITIYDQIGNLGLTHASYFTFKMRNFTYAKESHLNNTDSITFTLETNKFFQLQNLEEETWESIQQHAKEIYRLSSPMNSQKGDYTYAYTDTKTLKKSWAQHGEILLLTGWQQFPRALAQQRFNNNRSNRSCDRKERSRRQHSNKRIGSYLSTVKST